MLFKTRHLQWDSEKIFMSIKLRGLEGKAIESKLEALARLRLLVFREYPYLYDGDLEYERRYLKMFAQSDRALAVIVEDGNEVVGASTALPLADADDAFQKPFESPGEYYYFGESVLLKPYRGKGWGGRFFEHREAAARRFGFSKTCFCAVVRDREHPARPEQYRDLHSFWSQKGYRILDNCRASYSWRDLGDREETEKTMQFWAKLQV